MKVEVHPDDVDEHSADDRGRIYLGPEYADCDVEIAIVGVSNNNDDED